MTVTMTVTMTKNKIQYGPRDFNALQINSQKGVANFTVQHRLIFFEFCSILIDGVAVDFRKRYCRQITAKKQKISSSITIA